MKEQNERLLEEVIKDNLEIAHNSDDDPEKQKNAFTQAMSAIDRYNEMSKINLSHSEQVEKINKDEVFRKEQEKSNKILKILEIAVVPVSLCVINIVSRNRFAKKMCEFEKDYTFTTSPGRSLSSIFKWK